METRMSTKGRRGASRESERESKSRPRANIPISFPFGARLDADKAFLCVSTRVSASRVQFLLFFVLSREDVPPTSLPKKFVKHHGDVLCSYHCH